MDYKIVRSKRKTIGIVVNPQQEVIIRAPYQVSEIEIQKLINRKQAWINKQLEKQAQRQHQIPVANKVVDPELEKMYRKMAKAILQRECERFSRIMGVQYNSVTIRDQKSRWGSCSSKGNLNFSWRLILMHPLVTRYVVVHELAHLKHMNHSQEFWAEVEKAMPKYKVRKEWLKANGYKYIRN